MKKNQLLAVAGLLVTMPCMAQWTGTTDISNTNSGNVGIGTATPAAKLHVAGSFQLANGTQGAGRVLVSDANGLTNWQTQWALNGTSLHYNGGNIGIGTSAPAAKLDLTTSGNMLLNAVAGTEAGYTNYMAVNESYRGFPNVEFMLGYGSAGNDGSLYLASLAGSVYVGVSNSTTPRNLIIQNYFGNKPIIFSQGGERARFAETTGNLLVGTTTDANAALKLQVGGKSYFSDAMAIGITSVPDGYKLAVKGNIITEKVKVRLQSSGWPDYVFHPQYTLPPLPEVEQYILVNKHLPEVPSAKEIEEQGLDLGDGQAVLLKKIEELTLYIIEMNKKLERVDKLEAEVKALKKIVEEGR